MQDSPDLDVWVTMAMFECGCRTTAGREAKTLAGELEGDDLVCEVARRVWTRPGECERQMDAARRYAHAALAETRKAGLDVLAQPDARYPRWLREIPDPPPVLWVRGDALVLDEVAVGVVGSRSASALSLGLGQRLSQDLSNHGVWVVSGLAYGVDAAAHRGALDGAAGTIAVLGSGLSRIYPRAHAPLADRIAERGAVVTELPPSMDSLPRHFPLRNRIISGLSRAVVVVEAAERSGSLITARLANEQNRSVLAVPGMTVSGRHTGCHALIKDGARLVETVEDILEEIRWTGGPSRDPKISSKALILSELERALEGREPQRVDDLAARMGRTASVILAELAMLEVDGRVVRQPGGRFSRPLQTHRADPRGERRTHGKGIGNRRIAGKGEDD